MEALFWREAESNQVLPLNATTFTRMVQPRPSLAAGRTVFTFSGEMTGTPVDDKDYQVPFRFTGKLDKLTLTIDRPKLSPDDIKKLKMAMDHNPAQE
ncbi:hypothetical protein ACFL0N_04745 [Pseudomonadota bacterium]